MRHRNPDIQYAVATNGLRMVHIRVPRAAAGYCGVAVRVGSRDEDDTHRGLAHFVEHTIFKGTERRSSWHIINRMEAVGGELNAFTTKEETVIYTAFPAGNLSRGADLIADLICNSVFPQRELDKERDVVADEIDSYLDSPSDAVFDDFEDLIFADSPLGHNILGTQQALKTFDSETCKKYLRRWYVPSNMVAFSCGSVSHEKAFATLSKTFAQCNGEEPMTNRIIPATAAPFTTHRIIDTHQCHTIVGSRIEGLNSPDRYAMALLVNILGGPGMNSLLNIALRERRGLVYSVDASTGLFSDCGVLAIYYGCDPDDNDRCRDIVTDTISSVANGYITQRRLEAAKKQYLGQLVIAGENLENTILGVARQTLFRGQAIPTQQVIESIRAINTEKIAQLASTLLPVSTLTLGPEI